jgi:hypothetical protein
MRRNASCAFAEPQRFEEPSFKTTVLSYILQSEDIFHKLYWFLPYAFRQYFGHPQWLLMLIYPIHWSNRMSFSDLSLSLFTF